MPGYLPPYKSFCSRFEKPITQENDPAAVRRLNQLTGPFILRRMKSEVLKELPPKTENVYRIELEEEQRKLYLAAVVDAREKLRAAKPEDKMAVFAVLMRLREICCDPRLIADNWTGGSAKLDACIELVTTTSAPSHCSASWARWAASPSTTTQFSSGVNFWHSSAQFSTSEAGQTMRLGRGFPPCSRRASR